MPPFSVTIFLGWSHLFARFSLFSLLHHFRLFDLFLLRALVFAVALFAAVACGGVAVVPDWKVKNTKAKLGQNIQRGNQVNKKIHKNKKTYSSAISSSSSPGLKDSSEEKRTPEFNPNYFLNVNSLYQNHSSPLPLPSDSSLSLPSSLILPSAFILSR